MKRLNLPVIVFILSCLLLRADFLSANQFSRAEVLGAYLYNFARNITWPDEKNLNEFRFQIITSDPEIKKQAARLSRQRIRGKKIRVLLNEEKTGPAQVQLIFVGRDEQALVEQIFDRISDKHTLLVTENYPDKRIVMINFYTTRDKRIRFEINRANIISQGLKILPDMLLLGGSEVDVARIYRKSQQDMRKLRIKMLDLQARQQQLREKVAASNRKLSRQQELLARQKKLLSRQEALLKAKQEEFSREQAKLQTLLERVEQSKQKLRRQLVKGNQEIGTQEEIISQQLSLIDRQKDHLRQQEQNLAAGRLMLARQRAKIREQQREMEAKEELSRQRAELISRQRNLLFLLAGSLVFIALLALLVFVAYREKRKVNVLLAREKAKAEAASLAKTRFLAHVSHELRTPLNAILGFTRLLARDVGLPGNVTEKIVVIEKSGRHLLGLINDILDMSKIESGPVAVDPWAVDLQALLGDVAEMMRARAGEKGLFFEVDLDSRLPNCVLTDGQKLVQILLNLLGNSVKFTGKGGVVLKVRVARGTHPCREGSQVVLSFSIRDTGIGISPSALERIFEPFVQQETKSAGDGTGLGLAISRHLVRLLGGEISVKSTPGQGSEFIFTIDTVVAAAHCVHPVPDRRRVIGLSGRTRPFRILVAEDNGPSRKLLELMLKPVGFEIELAATGCEAVEHYCRRAPDLILMDIRMPDMNGLEAAKRIRLIEGDRERHVPIIAITAHAFEEERKIILEGGCDDFIRKPFSEQEIFQVIGRHIDLKYIYENQEDGENRQMFVDNAFVQAVCGLPEELRVALREAVLSLDLDAMDKALARIRPLEPMLAGTIEQLLNNYQYEQLGYILGKCGGDRG